VRLGHPLLGARVRAQIEHAASAHLGRSWVSQGFTSLDDRASHSCGILRGAPFSVFAKLGTGPDAREQFTAELAGLRLISPAVPVPVPVAGGLADTEVGGLADTDASGLADTDASGPGDTETGVLLLSEALPERPPGSRSRTDWRSIGHVLATVHQVRHERFGLDGPRGFFGPLPQDNRPVPGNRWAGFFRERRLLPLLRAAADSGHLPPGLAAGVEGIAARLPALAGPPEADLAMLDFFQPVPDDVLAAYQEILPVDPGFAGRRELWRLPVYLAVVAVAGDDPFGRRYLDRLAAAIRLYH
jgi:fructosamine-3-kinase